MFTGLIFSLLVSVALELPDGYRDAQWGMTVEQLKAQVEVFRASLGSEYNYADHTEQDPNVYVRTTKENSRIEYYFYKNHLYKVFIVADRSRASPALYEQLVKQTIKQHGKPKANFEEDVFGIKVQHNAWEDNKTILDVRFGAGFVYQVLIHKPAAKQKAQDEERALSI
jgi:hypothetical protein